MGEKLKFEDVLRKAEEEVLTRDDALYLFQKTQSWDTALQLFEAASKVRDENIFKDLRPGESSEHREKIVEATEKVGLGIDNTLMIDLGGQRGQHHPYQDWVDFLFYFKQFNNFRILEAHPFRPIKGSPTQDYPPGSSFEAVKTKAIGRLIFRDIEISGADDTLGLMAGANLIMHCLPAIKKTRVSMHPGGENVKMEEISDTLVFADNLPIVTGPAIELGMEVEL